jgi:ubiquinone/menaquinone biosynthesis C-methylase UbiE
VIDKILVWLTNLFFQLLYHQFAWSYDLVAFLVSLGFWNRWVNSITSDLNGHKILELGFGPGHLQKMLLEQGRSVFGIDRSAQMGKMASRRLRNQGLLPNLVNAQTQHIPFASSVFDQVTATFPTQYISEKLTIEEINRVLKSGGDIIILPSAKLHGTSLIHRFIGWLYLITGQTGNQAEITFNQGISRFAQMGYQSERENRLIGNSELTIIKLKKPGR